MTFFNVHANVLHNDGTVTIEYASAEAVDAHALGKFIEQTYGSAIDDFRDPAIAPENDTVALDLTVTRA